MTARYFAQLATRVERAALPAVAAPRAVMVPLEQVHEEVLDAPRSLPAQQPLPPATAPVAAGTPERSFMAPPAPAADVPTQAEPTLPATPRAPMEPAPPLVQPVPAEPLVRATRRADAHPPTPLQAPPTVPATATRPAAARDAVAAPVSPQPATTPGQTPPMVTRAQVPESPESPESPEVPATQAFPVVPRPAQPPTERAATLPTGAQPAAPVHARPVPRPAEPQVRAAAAQVPAAPARAPVATPVQVHIGRIQLVVKGPPAQAPAPAAPARGSSTPSAARHHLRGLGSPWR